MAQNANIKQRSGDEYYTSVETVKILMDKYRQIFNSFDYIWIPFNSDDKPIYQEFKKQFGDKVITLPNICYDEQLGFNDFFKWKEDKHFYNLITKNKTILFDNPPFSVWSKIVGQELVPHNINYILFGDSMTALNRVNKFKCGYRVLGRVPFENCEPKKRINISLFSNLWSDIKYEFGIGSDKADNSYGTMAWSDRVYIQKYKDRLGEVSSAEVINISLRGYIFKLKKIDDTVKSKKFGGGIFYNF